jgi:hypothetical protein
MPERGRGLQGCLFQLRDGKLHDGRRTAYVISLQEESEDIGSNDSKVAKYVESRQCGLPIIQRYPEADAATIIPFSISTILFVVRMTAKTMRLGGGWGADDYTIIGAYVSIAFHAYRCH